MVDLTISQLPDGSAIQTRSSETVFEEGGVTYRSTSRPNPPRQVNVTSQAQLELEFPGLVIPDNTDVTINIDDSFTLTNGFSIGLASRLELIAPTAGVGLTYTGAGPLFFNTNPANQFANLRVDSIILNATNAAAELLDVSCTGVVSFTSFQLSNFIDLGTANAANFLIESGAVIGSHIGLVLNVVGNLRIEGLVPVQTGVDNITLLSLLNGPSITRFIGINPISFFSSDTLFFFDPNLTSSSSIKIENCALPAGDFYQQGVDIAISSVADNGSGNTRYTTSLAHNLVIGQPVDIKDFVTQTTYNGAAIVTAVPTTTTFDTATTFVATDTGNMTEHSLEGDDIIVNAIDNPGRKDSLAAGETESNAVLSITATGPGTSDPIQDDTPTAGDFTEDTATERFSLDTSTGVLTYNGLEPLTCVISYQVDLIRDGGGAVDGTVSLDQNGTPNPKTSITRPLDTSVEERYIYVSGLFDVNTNDTFQLSVESSVAARTLTATDLHVIIREA